MRKLFFKRKLHFLIKVNLQFQFCAISAIVFCRLESPYLFRILNKKVLVHFEIREIQYLCHDTCIFYSIWLSQHVFWLHEFRCFSNFVIYLLELFLLTELSLCPLFLVVWWLAAIWAKRRRCRRLQESHHCSSKIVQMNMSTGALHPPFFFSAFATSGHSGSIIQFMRWRLISD